MNLDAYDDMMGLEFGEYEGLDGLFNPEELKAALVASTAGGGAILLATWGMKKLTDALGLEQKVTDPLARSAIVSAATFMVGVAGARGLSTYNREAALGVVGGLGGIAMANLIDALISKMTGQARMLPGLGAVRDGAYTPDEGMSALAQLEATSVQAAPGAFQGFAGPTVTNEALMGLEAATVQTETLGEYGPWMA